MDKLVFLQSEKVRDFLLKNEHTNPQQLVLNPPPGLKEHIGLLADQLVSRKKAKTKLPGWYQHKSVIFPPPLSLEQSSSQEASRYKKNLISGQHLIDLTGGMGIDTIALSQQFQETSYIEKDEWLCQLFKHNIQVLEEKNISIHHASAEDFLQNFDGKATFFIDPARRDPTNKKVFRFSDCTPNIVEILPQLTLKADKVLIKASPLIDLTMGTHELRHVTEIHVLSIKNECKEILFLIDFIKERPEPNIYCVNYTPSEIQSFQFQLSEEKKLSVDFKGPSDYLLDPNSSILKAGAFKSITTRYPVRKIALNTHLYTSEMPLKSFPGRQFEILEKNPNKKEIKALKQANIITKNFPEKPEVLKRKYGLKDGGKYFLIGFRDQKNKPHLVIAQMAL